MQKLFSITLIKVVNKRCLDCERNLFISYQVKVQSCKVLSWNKYEIPSLTSEIFIWLSNTNYCWLTKRIYTTGLNKNNTNIQYMLQKDAFQMQELLAISECLSFLKNCSSVFFSNLHFLINFVTFVYLNSWKTSHPWVKSLVYII